MPFVQLRGINLYYELKGVGPRLFYISGTGADLRNRPNIYDTPLARQFEILAFDQRGLGQTDRPDIAYSMEDYALDAASLLDKVAWDSCHVMGISFGGMVAQEFAIRFGDRVDRLVLCCTSSGGRGGHSYPFHTLIDLTRDEKNRVFNSLNDTRHDGQWRLDNPDEFKRAIAKLNQANAGEGEPNREIGARRQLEARLSHDVFDRLKQIKPPTLIAGGRFDGIAPKANLEAIHQHIPDSVLSFYEGGHDFYDTDPAAFVDIAGFLTGQV